MKQCAQCRRSYDDSQSFCLMDGTPLIDEPEEQTVVRPPAAPKKNSQTLWLGLAGLLIFIVGGLVAALLIYNFAGRNENSQAKSNLNAGRSPARTSSPAARTTPTPEAANSSANNSANNSSAANSSPETEESPAANTDSEDEVTPIDWSTTATGFKDELGMKYKFQCPPNGTEFIIWGSDIYTKDSSICTAAVHAGLFSLADGGVVTIEYRPGRLTYGSTERNGIKSRAFGEYPRSYVVR